MNIVATRKSEQNSAVADPWTLVHFSTGLALGLMDVDVGKALGMAIAYELVEQYVERQEWGQDAFETERPETVPNAILDVGVFAVGHWLGRLWNTT